MNKKKIVVPALALSVLLGGTVAGTQIASADEAEHQSFASRIAERFGIDESEVETFMEEQRTERQEERQAMFEERLTEAVENGELTEEQKNLIIEKHAEMQSEREDNRPERDGEKPTEEEREAMKTEREERRAELESWAEENGIDMEYFTGDKEGRGPGGMRGGK